MSEFIYIYFFFFLVFFWAGYLLCQI